jgi:hypothetical protein
MQIEVRQIMGADPAEEQQTQGIACDFSEFIEPSFMRGRYGRALRHEPKARRRLSLLFCP